MSNQLQITGGAKVRSLEGVITGTSGVLGALGINVANGIPQLDSSGKILVSQLPNSVMEYKGTWNVATNTPYLVNGVGNAGDVYIVTGAATSGTSHDFGAGPIIFYNGDQAIYDGSLWQRASGSTGSVTSVAMTTPTGLSVTGSPITTSGTLALSLASGYTIPTTTFLQGLVPYTGATQTVDLGSYDLNARGIKINGTAGTGHADFKHQSGTPTGSASSSTLYANGDGDIAWLNDHSHTITLAANANTADRTYTFPNASGTLALTSDISYPVTSVFGRTGAVTAQSGDYTTTLVTEGTNLYFTNARAIASTLTGYVSGAGTITSTDSILTAIQKLNGNVSGLVTGVSSVFGRTGAVVAASGDYTTTQVTEGTNLYFTNARARGAMSANVGSALTYDSATGRYTLLAADSGTSGYLTSSDWNTFNSKQASLGTGTTSQFLRGDLVWAAPPTPTLDDLTDVVITSPTNGQVLTYRFGDWKNETPPTAPVTSVFGRTGVVVATSGDYNTDLVTEGTTNLYYTNTRARGALSANVGSALTYNSSTGRFTLNAADGTVAGYVTASDYNYWSAKQASLGTGTTSQYLRGDLTWQTIPSGSLAGLSDVSITSPSNGQLLRYQAGTWINFTPTYIVAGYLSATAPLSYNSGTGVFSISQATTSTNGYLSSTDWNTFNGKINLTSLSAGTGISYNNTTGVISSTITQYTDANARAALSFTAGSGGYNSTTGVITIPTNNNQIANGAGYITSSSLSGYLPLTGGTLTGALNGTSATFSGIIKANATASGQLVIQAVASDGNASIYLRPNNGGYNLISSNYLSSSPYLPLTLSGRENNADLVLQTNGNITIGSTTDAGYKLDVNGIGRFSGNVTISGSDRILELRGAGGGANSLLRYSDATTAKFSTGFNGGSYIIYDDAAGAYRMTISSTGAATFSSSVTASGRINSGGGGGATSSLNAQQLSGDDAAIYAGGVATAGSSKGIKILAGTNSSDYALNVASYANSPILYARGDANIGIGTSSPSEILHLSRYGTTSLQVQNTRGSSVGYFSVLDTEIQINANTNHPLVLLTNGSERMRITSGGNVLIGTTTDAGYKLDVNGTGRFKGALALNANNISATFLDAANSNYSYTLQNYSGQFRLYNDNTSTTVLNFSSSSAATFVSSVTATGFFESSDKRLKKELADNPNINIEGIKPKLYIKDGREELGYYAQELQTILPSAVTEGKDGFLSLSYSQVHTAKIASLEREIAELKELIKSLIK